MGTFCFPLVQSFGYSLFFLHWPGRHYTHTEALTKFTQGGLSDSQQSLSVLNTKMCLMRKVSSRNTMALDIITASQGGTCAIIQTECCIFRLDVSAKCIILLNYMGAQVNALIDPTPSLGDLVNLWFASWGSLWKKSLLVLGIIILICFLLHVPSLCLW